MFSTKEQLIKKTGKHGVGRFAFLEQLVKEYHATKSQDAKEQVIANLANFAYDPVNYGYLWRLKVLDLFFSGLEDENQKIVSFAIAGICNICLEPLSREYILRVGGVKVISSLLASNEESIILSAITTLIFLDTPDSRQDITTRDNVKRILELSKSTNPRIKNLAAIFLKDLCNIDQNTKPVKRVIETIVGTTTKKQKVDQAGTSQNKSDPASATVDTTASTSSSNAVS